MPSATWHGVSDIGYLQQITSALLNQMLVDNPLFLFTHLVPIGTCIGFAGNTTPPQGYLLCNGSVQAQANYPLLYAAITSTFNTGSEGAGNFRLPNVANLATNIEYYIRAS